MKGKLVGEEVIVVNAEFWAWLLFLLSITLAVVWNRLLVKLVPRRGPYVIRAGDLVVSDNYGYVRSAVVGDDYIVGVATSDSEVMISGYTATPSWYPDPKDQDGT